jgi:acyl-coenzyme A thioesterase PaaI-like protein
MSPSDAVQDRYAPRNHCFGCGPSNEKGLRIKSRIDGDALVAEWTPRPEHEAFDGILSGGVIGALFDCHANWTAACHLMEARGAASPPCCVTADFQVRFLKPTPSTGPVRLHARVVEARGDRATVEATMEAGGKVTATCRGTFVAVKEGHPAFHRW